MANLGWNVREKISSDCWHKKISYTIWFERNDWHGKLAHSLTGHTVYFSGKTDKLDYESILNTVHHTAKMAKKAWHNFRNSIPYQTSDDKVINDVMFVDFKNGKDVHKNKKGNKKS